MYRVRDEVVPLESSLIATRRRLHTHAEIAFNEKQTAKYIADTLRSLPGFTVYENIGRTGVVGILRGRQERPCLALRADMDALPLTVSCICVCVVTMSVQHGRQPNLM